MRPGGSDRHCRSQRARRGRLFTSSGPSPNSLPSSLPPVKGHDGSVTVAVVARRVDVRSRQLERLHLPAVDVGEAVLPREIGDQMHAPALLQHPRVACERSNGTADVAR